MHIRAEFGAMDAAVSQMTGARQRQEDDNLLQRNQVLASQDFWSDDANVQGQFLANDIIYRQGVASCDELGARGQATTTSRGLMESCVNAVRGTFSA
jgi:hypothetical protein